MKVKNGKRNIIIVDKRSVPVTDDGNNITLSRSLFLSKVKSRLERAFYKDGVGSDVETFDDDVKHILHYIEELV